MAVQWRRSSLLESVENESANLSVQQTSLDSLLSNFADQASDPVTIGAMLIGGQAFQLGKCAGLRLASSFSQSTLLLKTSSLATGIALETTAFRAAQNHLGALAGRVSHGSTFDAQSWFSTALDFTLLKGAGSLSHESNLLMRHAAQDFAVVGGRHLQSWIGLQDRAISQSLTQELVDAEVMGLQMQAGASLGHMAFGGRLAAFERSSQLTHQAMFRRAPVSLTANRRGIENLNLSNLLKISPRTALVIAALGASASRLAHAQTPNGMQAGELLQSLNLGEGSALGAKIVGGFAAGFLFPILRTRWALTASSLLGAGLMLRPHANTWEWIGDFAMLGMASIYGGLRTRGLLQEAKVNPFDTRGDDRIPRLIETPPNLVSAERVHLNKSGTHHEIINPELDVDGLPKEFIWRVEPTRTLSNFQHFFFGFFDTIRTSTALGRLTRTRFSSRVVPWFARSKGINLEDYIAKDGSSTFSSFNDFFTRRFKQVSAFFKGAAPSEGTVVYMARISRENLDHVITLKGQRISIRALVGEVVPEYLPERIVVTITYLAPTDYHRGHTPFESKIVRVERIPGKAWTVQPEIWNEPDVDGQHGAHYLTFNDRQVVTRRSDELGVFTTVYVAALNVFSTTIHGKMGQEVPAGYNEQSYNLGSTNVDLMSADAVCFPKNMYPGLHLKFGKTPFLVPRPQPSEE